MKTLFLTRSFYPNIGGVEKHIFEITNRLTGKGHEITIITESSEKPYSINYHSVATSARIIGKAKKIRILPIQPRVEGKLKKYLIWFDLIKYWRVILASDIVHCHDVFYWYLPFRFIFPFKKVYTTFHGYEGNNMPTKKSILMHKVAEILSNGNICVGDFLKKWYGTKPTFVTYGAVDKKLLNVSNIKKNKMSPDRKIRNLLDKNNKIIFVGRLEKETGILTYLNALTILKEKGLKFSVDVYGDGSLKNEVIKYSKENNLDLRLKGFILNIESVLNKYEYIFCSRYLSILEGLAVRLPIFAEYNNPIKKDYLIMSPFAKYISISRDAESIADSLQSYVLGNKKLDLDEGYNWVKDKTWDTMTNTYLNLWKTS